MVLLRAVFLDSQCGGFPGKGTGIASLGVRAFLAATRACGVSSVALFLDLKSGFYTVVRELAMRLDTATDDYERVLDSIGIPWQLESSLLRLLERPPIVEEALRDPHLAALLSEAHTNTWFVVDGRSEAARAVKGSRPGCSLADLVFNVAFAPALADARAALRKGRYLWTPPAADAVFARPRYDGPADAADASVSDCTYADDSCFCCAPRSNEHFGRDLADMCARVARALLKRGMVINWLPGKSAALAEPRGRHARTAKRHLFCELQGRLSLPGGIGVVHLDRSYKHLGTEVTMGGAMGPAVASRIRAHAQGLAPLRRTVCPRRNVSDWAKLVFVDSLATSRLCHGIGAWDALSKAQAAKMQAALAAGYRHAMRLPHRNPVSERHPEAEVMAAAGRLGFMERAMLRRLRLLPAILEHGPQSLLLLLDALLQAGTGWPALLRTDLKALHGHWGEGPPGGADAVADWVLMARSDPKAWLSGIRRAEGCMLFAYKDECLRTEWRKQLDEIFLLGKMPLPAGAARPPTSKRFLCYDCGAVLASRAAWRAHRRTRSAAPCEALCCGVRVLRLPPGLSHEAQTHLAPPALSREVPRLMHRALRASGRCAR